MCMVNVPCKKDCGHGCCKIWENTCGSDVVRLAGHFCQTKGVFDRILTQYVSNCATMHRECIERNILDLLLCHLTYRHHHDLSSAQLCLQKQVERKMPQKRHPGVIGSFAQESSAQSLCQSCHRVALLLWRIGAMMSSLDGKDWKRLLEAFYCSRSDVLC